MYKKILKVLGVLSVVAVLAVAFVAIAQPDMVYASTLDSRGGPGGGGGNGQGNGSGNSQGNGSTNAGAGYALTPLTEVEKDALTQAILEEYGALNLYQSVIDQLGDVYPFSQIVVSEQQHVNALVRQATKYNVAVPANPGLTTTTSFDSLSDACQAGVAAETADVALYDSLEVSVTHSDILNVFSMLQSASLNSHLPAFEVCQ